MRRRAWLAMPALLLGGFLFPQLRSSRGNLWSDIFGHEPIEKLALLFLDGDCYVLTNNDPNGVDFPEAWLQEIEGQDLGEAMVCIHNHVNIGRFSDRDRAFYRWLRSRGFRGRFLLRLDTGKVLEYELKADLVDPDRGNSLLLDAQLPGHAQG